MSFGTAAYDHLMIKSDDGHSDSVGVSNIEFLNINITSIYIYTNGLVTLNAPLEYEGQLPGEEHNLSPDQFGKNNLLAPFWSDVSTINGGDVFYRHVLDTESLRQVGDEIHLLHGKDSECKLWNYKVYASYF